MNKNLYSSLYMVAAVVIILNFSSCGKYEDGPAFSLRTKTSRLTGEWEVVQVGDQAFPYDGYSVEFEFEKDGDFEFKYIYSDNGQTYSYGYSGEWEWEDKKEVIEISLNGYIQDFEVTRLTNKELEMTDSDGNEWELEKKK